MQGPQASHPRSLVEVVEVLEIAMEDLHQHWPEGSGPTLAKTSLSLLRFATAFATCIASFACHGKVCLLVVPPLPAYLPSINERANMTFAVWTLPLFGGHTSLAIPVKAALCC